MACRAGAEGEGEMKPAKLQELGEMAAKLLATARKGRFGKQDFVYVAADDVYLCPAGEQLTYRYTNEEDGKTLRSACLDSLIIFKTPVRSRI
jgi:hypothetical protein